ncbi:hypothetical protein RhiirB3_451272 [Rhizophagus irregularis]|nr:hypothetical protein RhiirB3_451272 [Rhizophagus irregularis]
MIRMLNLIEGIDPSIKEITIKFAIPVKLPTANELNDDKYKPDLLRQTFSGDSKLCTMESVTEIKILNEFLFQKKVLALSFNVINY